VNDIDRERAALIATRCRADARQLPCDIRSTLPEQLDEAFTDPRFIIHSIRVDGIAACARRTSRRDLESYSFYSRTTKVQQPFQVAEVSVCTNFLPGQARSNLERLLYPNAKTSPTITFPVVSNRGALPELAADDVVEVPCSVNAQGAHPQPCGAMPASVAGLVQAVKEYERLTIRAAVEHSADLAGLSVGRAMAICLRFD
jgi:alpha-galactosidase/6-phospho-beta-glucosidase family protein